MALRARDQAGDEGQQQAHEVGAGHGRMLAASVPEVPGAGEDHRDAALVGGGDDLVVAHRCRRAG
jgi:hypothetical protein